MEELVEMADCIGVARKHLQTETTYLHYDICKAKRANAVKRGAIELGARDFIRKARQVAMQDGNQDNQSSQGKTQGVVGIHTNPQGDSTP